MNAPFVSDSQWNALCLCLLFVAICMPSGIGSELRDIAKAINNLADAIRDKNRRDK